MSAALEARVWAAHPLTPAHRLVLLSVARQVPDGLLQAVVARQALARDLETTPETVRKALVAGEQAGLCEILRNGGVAFTQPGLPGLRHVDEVQRQPAVLPREGPAAQSPVEASTGTTGRWVQSEFARQWEARYQRQRYLFSHPKDDRLAAEIARLGQDEVTRRVANYLAHPDPFYAQCAHAFGVFRSRVNSFAVASGRGLADEHDRAERRYQQRSRA